MDLKDFLHNKFRFNIYCWLVIFAASIIAIESYTFQQLPSIVYFTALWLSLPVQVLFIGWYFNKDGITNANAILTFFISLVIVQLLTNPYLSTAMFWYSIVMLDFISGPLILVWGGFSLYSQRLAEA